MLSKIVPVRVHRPANAWRSSDRALGAGLAFYLLMCCVVVAGFVLEFIRVMQPTRYPNPGVSAYALPSSGAGEVREFPVRNEAEPTGPAVVESTIEPDVKTVSEATPQPTVTKKTDQATAPAGAKPKRPAQPREREPARAYAQAPFGAHRSWGGTQAWRSNRPWGSYQSWSNDRSWGRYQAPGGPQSRH